jgi:hypothetical protein
MVRLFPAISHTHSSLHGRYPPPEAASVVGAVRVDAATHLVIEQFASSRNGKPLSDFQNSRVSLPMPSGWVSLECTKKESHAFSVHLEGIDSSPTRFGIGMFAVQSLSMTSGSPSGISPLWDFASLRVSTRFLPRDRSFHFPLVATSPAAAPVR